MFLLADALRMRGKEGMEGKNPFLWSNNLFPDSIFTGTNIYEEDD